MWDARVERNLERMRRDGVGGTIRSIVHESLFFFHYFSLLFSWSLIFILIFIFIFISLDTHTHTHT